MWLVMTKVEQKLMLNRLTRSALVCRLVESVLRKCCAFECVTALTPLIILLCATLTLPLWTASACVL